MAGFDPNPNWYGWSAPETELTRAKRTVLSLSAVNAVISVLTGVCPTGVTRDNWVGFAATAALVALMVEIIGAARFRMAKETLSAQQFHGVHRMLSWGALYHLLLMTAATLAGAIACVRDFTGPLDLLAVAGMALTALCSLAVRRIYRAIPTYEAADPDR